MLKKIIMLFLRSKRIRNIVISTLAAEVHDHMVNVKNAVRSRKRKPNRLYCADCIFFGNGCASRNAKGYCDKHTPKEN